MSNEAALTPIQTKILVALVKSKLGSLYTDEIIRLTGIATSTWSAEQGKLTAMGLIEKHLVRIIELNHISKRMNYKLTEKGKFVGLNLLNISRVLSIGDVVPRASEGDNLAELRQVQVPTHQAENNSKNHDFDSIINECVEIALDSFGSNLVDLVKHSLEVEHKVEWIKLAEKTEDFQAVLRDYFGLQAAEKLDKLIAANLKSRFDLQACRSDDLPYLVAQARLKNIKVEVRSSVEDEVESKI